MAEMPDVIRRAIEAQGKVSPDDVLAAMQERDPIPSDLAELERENWRAQLPDAEPEPPVAEQLDLSDAERAMMEPRVRESTPKARTLDPATSHAAAEAARITAQSAKAALLIAHYDALAAGAMGLTDEEAATRAGLSLQSEYATRCSELRKLEPPLLVETGEEREGRAGVARMVSLITSAGVEYVREHGWRD